jgi:hypothetical protein
MPRAGERDGPLAAHNDASSPSISWMAKKRRSMESLCSGDKGMNIIVTPNNEIRPMKRLGGNSEREGKEKNKGRINCQLS